VAAANTIRRPKLIIGEFIKPGNIPPARSGNQRKSILNLCRANLILFVASMRRRCGLPLAGKVYPLRFRVSDSIPLQTIRKIEFSARSTAFYGDWRVLDARLGLKPTSFPQIPASGGRGEVFFSCRHTRAAYAGVEKFTSSARPFRRVRDRPKQSNRSLRAPRAGNDQCHCDPEIGVGT